MPVTSQQKGCKNTHQNANMITSEKCDWGEDYGGERGDLRSLFNSLYLRIIFMFYTKRCINCD